MGSDYRYLRRRGGGDNIANSSSSGGGSGKGRMDGNDTVLRINETLYTFNSTNSTSEDDGVRKFTHPIFSRAALIGICMFWLLMLVGPCVVASLENKRRLKRNEKLYKLENNTLKVN